MDTPERSSRSYGKREEEGSELRAGEDEEWEGGEKRKHRSGRSRKPGDDVEAVDGGGGRRRGKRSGGGGGGRGESDEDDYEARRESRAKLVKKKPEESSLERLSNWYQDGELESSRLGSGGDKTAGGGSRGHVRGEESERRKAGSKVSEHESSRGGNKSREERSQEGDQDKIVDQGDAKQLDRKESVREKGSSSVEVARSSRRRWDEPDSSVVPDDSLREKTDSRGRKDSDSKYENSRERNASSRNEVSDSKSKGLDSNREKAVKTDNKEERRVEIDRSKSRCRTEGAEDDNRGSPVARDDRSTRDKSDKHRQQRTSSGREGLEGRERYPNVDEDGNVWTRDKKAREAGHSNRSRSPERNVRRHQESQLSEVDYERGTDTRRKDIERDSNREDRPKGRDENWGERKRDWDSRENWKRRQPASNDRESKDGDVLHDRSRDWEPRHPRDRNENERPHGRSRGEAVKTSSNYGISNDDYDVIEIQTKPLDYGRTDSSSNFSKRGEFGQQSDPKSVANGEEWGYTRDERARRHDGHGSGPNHEASKDRFPDEGASAEDPSMWRDDLDNHGGRGRGQRGAAPGRNSGVQTSSSGPQHPLGNHEQGSFGRPLHQGVKGSRVGRGGRGRPGRDSQPVGLPLPIMGSPFGPLGMPPPGPMQPLGPGMSPAPGPPMSPGVFIPPFSPPVVWPGARGMDMSMLGVPPALPPVPPGPSGPRFPPNMGTPPSNPAMFFNQAGSGRGMPQGVPGPGYNAAGPGGRGPLPDKAPGGWVPPRNNGPPGKAPSRGEQNDYSQNFVDTGMRPQNFIRELELTNVVEDYPKLRELIQKKDEIVSNSASAPMYFKCDLKEFELSPEFFGTKFDVILVDPPWEEYVHRAPGVADHMEYWTYEEILNLKIEAIADTPSFIFLWVGDGVGLEQGRQCLKKWGFRRCEDICWVKTNKATATPGSRHDDHTLFQHSKEHCLMGIKGTVRRSTDGHIIHANIDTDVIIAEEPPYGSTQKPEDMYRIVEHFALGRRRLELFGEDHNIRAGWVTVGNGLSSSNFNSEAYMRNFADKDGKVWQGGGGRNPPPEAPHLVLTTPDIEALRPKSPMKNQQQSQPQQSNSISLATASSSNRRPAANSPQNPSAFALNQETSSSNPSTPATWASPMENFRRDSSGPMPMEDKVFDMYGYNGPAGADFVDFESHRPLNLL